MNYLWRYILWLISVIVLIAIVVILLLPSNKKSMSGTTFINYSSTNATASLTIDGPEGAESTHQAVKIDINKNQVTYSQLAGYNYNVTKVQTYNNNQTAYNVFLRSLYFAGFLKGNSDPKLTNPSGICPLGDRYIFNFTDGSDNLIQHFWATTCGNKTYGGNLSLTVTLFQNQIPDYSNLTQNITF